MKILFGPMHEFILHGKVTTMVLPLSQQPLQEVWLTSVYLNSPCRKFG
jgi:hypothetical protein